jgi:tripartite motif-containing protein 71
MNKIIKVSVSILIFLGIIPSGYAALATDPVFFSTAACKDSVTQQYGTCVVKFDSNWIVKKEWDGSEKGTAKFNQLADITKDSHGNIYTADSADHVIKKFDSDGNFIAQWYVDGGGTLGGVTVDTNDNVYVADRAYIRKYTCDGTRIAEWAAPSCFKLVSDSKNNIFVVDVVNNQIEKFDSTGKLLAKWGGQGTGQGKFIIPFNIAVNAAGNVYVTDFHNISESNARIQEFDTNGQFISQWFTGKDSQSCPAMTIDSQGNVYVDDVFDRKIYEYDASGKQLKFWYLGTDIIPGRGLVSE